MITESDYRKALKDESYRQHFLNQLDIGDASRLIGKLIYKPESEVIDGHYAAMYVRQPQVIGGNLQQSEDFTVTVLPEAFRPEFTLQEFTAQAIDHEGFHLYEFAYFPELSVFGLVQSPDDQRNDVLSKIFRGFREMRAYSNQLDRALEKQFSKRYIENVRAMLKFYSDSVETLIGSLDKEPEVWDIDFVYDRTNP